MENAEYIWRWFLERIGNEYGVAGLEGNLRAESALDPMNLQNSYEKSLGMTDAEYTAKVDSGEYTECAFVHDRAGFGLAQWSYWSRKQGLYDHAKLRGTSVGDLETQLEYLWIEIAKYPKVIKTLLNAQSVREASDAVMVCYENPADTSEKNKAHRAALGQALYDLYAVDGVSVSKEKNASEETAKDSVVLNAKAEKVIAVGKSLLGCKYVYGATGQIRDGRPVFDCRGYTWYLLNSVGISISKVGATTQYNTASDWVERGLTKDIPNLVCNVFKYRASDGKMSHTGMHIGDGAVLHCTENGGVKYGSLTDTTWTNYAIPKGLYSEEEIKSARRVKMRTLKKGCAGNDVQELQERLNALGYNCGAPDGIFGTRTETAVKSFQSENGLYVDGIAGPATLAALDLAEDSKPTADETLPKGVLIPIDQALQLARTLCDQLGLVIDARSGNVANIDYQ